MELTLKQARNLEKELRSKGLNKQVIKVRAYDPVIAEQDLRNGVVDLRDQINDVMQLNDIRFDIKNSINEKNMECGVSKLLNDQDAWFQCASILNVLGEADSVERQVTAIKNNLSQTAMVSTFTEDLSEEVNDIKAEISASLSGIRDKLNELNNTVKIELSAEDVGFLKLKGIL